MELEYDFKKVDWKEVKGEWDKSPMFYNLKIKHGENTLTFQPYLDKTKRYKLGLYINGWMKGEYYTEGHEFGKYFCVKTLKPSKVEIRYHRIMDKKCKKMTDSEVIKYKEIKIPSYKLPGFDNIAQIKKMVTALE